MHFYDCLKVTVLYKDDLVILARGDCTDCGRFFHCTSYRGLYNAKEYLKAKFRKHIDKRTQELCISGMPIKRIL